MAKPKVLERRKKTLQEAREKGLDFGGKTCPYCGSEDFMPSSSRHHAKCNSCHKDMAEYKESVKFKTVDCCANCKKWEHVIYARSPQGYMQCRIARDEGYYWPLAIANGWCEKHSKK